MVQHMTSSWLTQAFSPWIAGVLDAGNVRCTNPLGISTKGVTRRSEMSGPRRSWSTLLMMSKTLEPSHYVRGWLYLRFCSTSVSVTRVGWYTIDKERSGDSERNASIWPWVRKGSLWCAVVSSRQPPPNAKGANTAQCCHITSRARALPASEAGSSADSGRLNFVFVFRASSLTLLHNPFRPVSLSIYLVGDIVFVVVFFNQGKIHITYNEFFFFF